MIESNKLSPSLLTRSFHELQRSASSQDESRLNNMNHGLSSAPALAVRSISASMLTTQSSESALNLMNPKSLLPRYQAASALKELASVLLENERVSLYWDGKEKAGFSAIQLREKAQHLSPQLNDSQLVHGQSVEQSTPSREHRISQLLGIYTQRIREVALIENPKSN